MSNVEIAPAAVARVAAFPLAVLSEFANPSLADQAEAAARGRSSWSDYEARYKEAVEAGRERLWELTIADPRFMVALAFANPGLAERILSTPVQARTGKSRRQLGTTLYRYLARAAGRCQPFGLWAGVTLVRWGPETRIVRALREIKVEPDLRPLFAVFCTLARTSKYRHRGLWQVNPSLGRRTDGSWSFWAPTENGSVEHCVRPKPGVDVLLERLSECGPATLETIASVLEPYSESLASARATVATCAEGGVIVGGMQPPWSFQTAWEALEKIKVELLAEDQGAWNKAGLSLAAVCRRLEENVETLTPQDVLSGMEDAARALRDLAEALHVPCPELPGVVLRCNEKSPVEIQLGEDIRARIEGVLAEYLRFQGDYGFGGAIRRALRTRFVSAGSRACALNEVIGPLMSAKAAATWEELGRIISADGDFTARIDRWKKLLQSSGDRIVATGHGSLVGPPFGWLHLGLTAPPGAPYDLVVHGIFDDLWGPYARHAPFWNDGSGADPLRKWYPQRLGELQRSCRIDLAELLAPCWQNPNVLAHPPLARLVVSPWSCVPGAIALRDSRIWIDPDRDTPLLMAAGATNPIAVLNTAAADLQSGDPIVQLLLTTSLGATPSAALQASSMAFADELDCSHPSPEIVLPDGSITRTRRSILGDRVLSAWRPGNAARRFAGWVQFARQQGWTSILMVRRDDGVAMPVHRDSPLAVAAVFEGLRSGVVTIENWPGEAWIDVAGKSYVAELAIPFLRHEHVWSYRQSAESPERLTATDKEPQ